MKRASRWIGLAGAVLVATSGIATFAVGVRSESTAQRALEGAVKLRAARLDLAQSQQKLGRSDLSDAIEGAEKANESAGRVVVLTRHISDLVAEAEGLVRVINSSSSKSADSLELTAARADLVAAVLGAISGYQGDASDSARRTNEALEKILAALRETNRNFPGTVAGTRSAR